MIHDECAGIIYKFTSPSGKSYIGQTIHPRRRKNQHKREAKKGLNRAFDNAIRKYGWEAFSYEVLYEATSFDQNLLNQMEVYYVNLYDSFVNGYNETMGGHCGIKKFDPSTEQRKKISEANSKEVSQYDMNGTYICTYCSIREAAKTVGCGSGGISRACGKCQHTSAGFQWRYGNSTTNIGPPNIPKSKGPLGRTGKLNGRSKQVYQYSLDGKLMHIWESALQAQREEGYRSEVICKAVKDLLLYGKVGQPKFFWSFSLLEAQEVVNIINIYYEWTEKVKAKKGTPKYYLRDIRKPRVHRAKKKETKEETSDNK